MMISTNREHTNEIQEANSTLIMELFIAINKHLGFLKRS